MKNFFCYSLLLFLPLMIFGMGVRKTPMKPYDKVDIPDGEYLRYAIYTGDEKDSDNYYITRILTNKNGGILYKIYSYNIPQPVKIPPAAYTNWPSFFLIDPRGSVLEMEQTYDTNSSLYKNSTQNYPFYFHYLLDPEKGYVDETIKFIKGKNVTSSEYRVKVNKDYPAWDQLSYSFYSARFMDAQKGGIAYMVAPFMIKEPAPFTFHFGKAETIQTKAGKFHVNKLKLVLSDPFISKLTEAFTGDMVTWIEDSRRRLLIQSFFMGNVTVLEEISNVKSDF